MQRALVTGATGYLGSRLVTLLLDIGWDVVALHRSRLSLRRLEQISNRIVLADTRQFHSAYQWSGFFKEQSINLILHTATSYGRNGESQADIFKTNLEWPLTLLEAAKSAGVGYFLNTDTGLPQELNHYTQSKKLFRQELVRFASPLKVVNLPLEHFFGPGDGHFLSSIAMQMLKKVPSIPLTLGEQKRDFIYIDDLVEAYSAIIGSLPKLFSNETEQAKFFAEVPIGSGQSIAIKDLVEMVRVYTEADPHSLIYGGKPYREGEPMLSVADPRKIRSLGWRPKISLEEGIQCLVTSLRRELSTPTAQGRN